MSMFSTVANSNFFGPANELFDALNRYPAEPIAIFPELPKCYPATPERLPEPEYIIGCEGGDPCEESSISVDTTCDEEIARQLQEEEIEGFIQDVFEELEASFERVEQEFEEAFGGHFFDQTPQLFNWHANPFEGQISRDHEEMPTGFGFRVVIRA